MTNQNQLRVKVKINVNLRVVSKITLIIILFISLKKLILNSCDCLNKDLNFKGNLNIHGDNYNFYLEYCQVKIIVVASYLSYVVNF